MMTAQIETCEDRQYSMDDAMNIELQELLQFDGVKDNECLQRVRSDMYGSEYLFGDDVNLRLCNGEFDFKCPKYPKFKHYQLSSVNSLQQNASNADGESVIYLHAMMAILM